MDQQNILFLGFLTVTLAVSAFILWGPTPRQKKKKGQIVGLENLGSTCFLNTLLQALASCAFFMEWLMDQKHEEGSLTSCLRKILWVLNGEGRTDTYTPVEVLSALKRHGWMVPSGEQDAHELFHVIISTLQDENQKMNKSASLSDALPDPDDHPHRCNTVGDKSNCECEECSQARINLSEAKIAALIESMIIRNEVRLAQGDTGNPDSEESPPWDSSLMGNEVQDLFSEDTLEFGEEESHSPTEGTEEEARNNCGDVEEAKPAVESANDEGDSQLKDKQLPDLVLTKDCKTSQEGSRENSSNYNGCYNRVAGRLPPMPHIEAPPFQGLLTSTLQCSVCGYFSSLHYDTFDSLSLPLGDNFHLQVVKLQDLLQKFIRTEIISDVECRRCCKKTTALKTMNFGKLPACLCLHIARTTWQSYSHAAAKRHDFVDFPEYLPMDDYTVLARMKKKSSDDSADSTKSEAQASEKKKTYKHVYRLKSVVVHLGDVSSGHFVTYRRGALNSLKRHRMENLAGAYTDSRRWFMASDDNVKMSTLCEAMESLAYMLFYEKCTPDMYPMDNE